MNERGKSDGPVVPAKPANKAAVAAAESVEERRPAEGNTASKTRPGHSAGPGAPSALDRVREVARRDKEARFTALLHHVDVDSPAGGLLGDPSEGRAGGGRGDVGRLRAGVWRPTSRTCTSGCTQGVTGRDRHAGRTSRRRTGGNGRSASPRWRTRSSSGPSSRCSTPSTRWTFWASPTGFGRGAIRITRWMRSRSGSGGRG